MFYVHDVLTCKLLTSLRAQSQPCSSSSSGQSGALSHTANMGMHEPFLHLNSSGVHSVIISCAIQFYTKFNNNI
jgi:hypothetical protein